MWIGELSLFYLLSPGPEIVHDSPQLAPGQGPGRYSMSEKLSVSDAVIPAAQEAEAGGR
jgi:hypothetical protein